MSCQPDEDEDGDGDGDWKTRKPNKYRGGTRRCGLLADCMTQQQSDTRVYRHCHRNNGRRWTAQVPFVVGRGQKEPAAVITESLLPAAVPACVCSVCSALLRRACPSSTPPSLLLSSSHQPLPNSSFRSQISPTGISRLSPVSTLRHLPLLLSQPFHRQNDERGTSLHKHCFLFPRSQPLSLKTYMPCLWLTSSFRSVKSMPSTSRPSFQALTPCSKTFLARLCEQAERYDGKTRPFGASAS
jgi:hypothetical protein